MSEMFEKAARQKLRFSTPVGNIGVEELWELPLTAGPKQASLDALAIQLDKEQKEAGTTSFVKKQVKGEPITKLKFDIVLRVIEVRQAEAEIADQKRDNAEKKQKLLKLIAEKQDESLKGKSVEELLALAKDL